MTDRASSIAWNILAIFMLGEVLLYKVPYGGGCGEVQLL